MGFKLKNQPIFAISFLISLLPLINGHGHANYPPQPLDHKAYLQRYGYLDYARANAITTDDESDIAKSAIITFQENFHIKPTGILDSETITAMNTPRCGVPDIINGTNYMQARARNYSSKYATFPNSPKWSNYQLSYLLEASFPSTAKFSLELAFAQWKSNSFFNFTENEGSDHDLTLGFYRGEHGDGLPFDGPGGVLAHGFPPNEGEGHFDVDEKWSYENANGAPSDAIDFETVALHEIGHLLGLAHTPIAQAIMYPLMEFGKIKTLGDDDIQGIRSLYG